MIYRQFRENDRSPPPAPPAKLADHVFVNSYVQDVTVGDELRRSPSVILAVVW